MSNFKFEQIQGPVNATAKKNTLGSAYKRGVLSAVIGLMAAVGCLACCANTMAGETSPGPRVAVTGNGMAWSDAVTFSLSDFTPWAVSLDALDPNFPEDGKQVFKGIKLSRVLELAGLKNRFRLTVVGSDQYVGVLPPRQVDQGMLVWEAAGQPVSGLRGGPFKLMFPTEAGVHASCYTWYVAALVQGRPKVPDLTVTVQGETLRYPMADLAARAEPLPSHLVSIAQGCRNAFTATYLDQPVRGVSLTRLTGDLSFASSVELIPYSGPVVRLTPDALAFDAWIIVRCGDKDLHPALGGPFTVVFPVEDHRELTPLVPESGAFFFLKTVVVN